MRRVLLIAGGAAAALLLVAVLTVMVLLATAPGHNALRKYGLAALNDAVAGRATVGRVGGTLWRGAEAEQVELRDTTGAAVIRVGRVRVGYGLRDLLRRRLIFRDIELVRPTVVLEQRRDGSWNVQHLFRLGDTADAAPRARMLVDLRGVRITDGTLIVRRRVAPDSLRTSRFLGINTQLRRLRVSHPDSSAIEAVIASFAARMVDPAVTIADMEGSAALDGDSARFDLRALAVGAGTRLAARGRVRWGGRRTVGEIAFDAGQVLFADLRGIVPDLPREGGGSVVGRVVLPATGGAAVVVERAQFATGRSRVGGSARLTVGARGGVTVSEADVSLAPLDLRTLEQWLDTLPVHGLVTGRARGRGAANDLALTVTATFRDDAAPAAAPSHVTLDGRVRLGGPDGVVAHGVRLRRVDLALASMRRFAAGIPGQGRVGVAGVLNGPWRDLRLDSATITLADGTAPATVLTGEVLAQFHSAPRLTATLTIDTMSFAQLAKFVPGIPLHGRASGALGLSGALDSLDFNLSLHGDWGAAQARGLLRATDSLVRVDVAGTVDSLDLRRHVPAAPATRLSGRWSAVVDVPGDDSAGGPVGSAQLVLDSVRVAGVPFASAGARVGLERARYVVDTLWLLREDFVGLAVGALGKGGAGPGQVTFSFRADTLERLAPLARWIRAAARRDTAGRDTLGVPRGSARLSGRLIGTVTQLDVDATLEAPQLRLDSMGARDLHLVVVASPFAERPRFDVLLRADSLWRGGLGYGNVDVRGAGTADSLAARAAATFGRESGLQTAVRLERDATRLTAHVDGLRLVLPTRSWELTRPFAVTMDADSITVDTFDLRATTGAGRVYAAGSLPRGRPGDFSLTADSVSLPGIYALAGRDTSGIGGWVGMNLRITGPAAAPTMNIVAVVEDGRFEDYRVPLFQVVGRYEERRLTFKGGLWRDTLRVLNVGASLPLDLSLTAVPRRRLEGSYVVQAQADSVDLALLNQITDVVRDPSGRLTADVEARGSWGEPLRLSGRVRLDGGAMTIPVIGARYSNVDARFTLADSVITVERARLSSGGTLDVAGRVVLRRGAGNRPLLDLQLDADRFNAINMREFAGVTATGELALRGPTLGATLRGRATVDAGYLMFADLVEKRIVNLDDPEFRAIVDSSLALSRELAPSVVSVFMDSLRIANMTVAMGSSVWLRSTEANIQLSGEFRVSKTVEDGLPRYRLDGTLNANRGTYRLNLADVASKDFRVTRGTVRFFGSPDFNPELDIAAEHVVRTVDGGQLVVRAVITGTILAPQLRLESDQAPPLSETEIVSYLMFGRPTFELESGPGASNELGLVATAVTSLAGISAGILEQSLMGELGIDYLTIRPGAASSEGALLAGARIEAGKQLGGRTFLTLNAGLCEVRHGQVSKLLGATLEYRLSRRWTLETSYEPIVSECRADPAAQLVGTNYQLGLDLFWQSGIR